jgi:hypothetical protein
VQSSSKPEADTHNSEEVSRLAPLPVSVSEPSPVPPVLTLESPELYFNRELSLLEFQKRVLEQAQDAENPLLHGIPLQTGYIAFTLG